jgi:hypothetical protein
MPFIEGLVGTSKRDLELSLDAIDQGEGRLFVLPAGDRQTLATSDEPYLELASGEGDLPVFVDGLSLLLLR